MAAKFVAEEGALRGLVLSLDQGDEWIIGRDPDNAQLLVEDPSVSRQHLLCKKENGAGYVLQNLSETNPALVNGEPVQDFYQLRHGDIVTIGSETFRFYAESEAHLYEIPEDNSGSEVAADEEFSHPDMEDLLTDIDFNIDETGRWLLKVIGGPNHGAEFFMQPESSYVIGTDPNRCDIVFHDTSVSRQHARLTIDNQDHVWLEDLKSRNGTLVDGESLKGRREVSVNVVIHVGTTSFVVLDREGKMQTIISPLMPSIVKMLQKEELKEQNTDAIPASDAISADQLQSQQKSENSSAVSAGTEHSTEKPISQSEKTSTALSAFIIVAVLSSLLAFIGFGASSLFKTPEAIVTNKVENPDAQIEQALAAFPQVKFYFSQSTGRLLLIGHVVNSIDKQQIRYNLEGLPFIKDIDENSIVIDDVYVKEINPLIARNGNWKSITIQVQSPGRFVVSGFLDTREQAESLEEYLNSNFTYPDLLEKNFVVEEDSLRQAESILRKLGFKDVAVQVKGGELTLAGGVPLGKQEDFKEALIQLKTIPGIRNIRNIVSELAPEQSLINISDKFRVTGSSTQGNRLTVVINGRVLSRGDSLEDMVITSIKPNKILLERDGTRYYINYNQ